MIAKTLKVLEMVPDKSPKFIQLCQDILASETSRVGSKTNQGRVKDVVRELVEGILNKELEAKKEMKRERTVESFGKKKIAANKMKKLKVA
jgi:predicted component of type VI protein secretion system